MDTPELLRGLAIALAASALTLAAHEFLLEPQEAQPADPLPITAGREEELESLLARLEALLERPRAPVFERPRATDAAASRRTVVESAGDVDEGELQEILRRLTELETRLRQRPAIVRELLPLDRQRVPDVAALRAAIELRRVDRDALRFDLRMRTMHEIVERFGYPTEASSCGGSNCDIYWKYDLPSADPDNPNYFCLYFKNGLVLWTEDRWTD